MEKEFRFNVLQEKLISRSSLPIDYASDEQKTQHEELLRQRRETLDEMRDNMIKRPEDVFPKYLKMLVDDPDSMAKYAPLAARKYPYVAKHLLDSIEGIVAPETDYYSFEQFCVEDTFSSSRSIYFRLFNFDEDHPFESIYEELLESYIERFQNAVATACHMVYLGVPMYVCDPTGEMIENRVSEQYQFVKSMGKYFYPPSDYEAPKWINDIYLKRSDIERHYLIFSQPTPPSEEEEKALIKAFRVSLNLPLDKDLVKEEEPGFRTRLAQHASSMIEHFEGQGYSRSRSGEWPLQKAVVFWLTTNAGLSNREAEAVDLITRPDHLRTR